MVAMTQVVAKCTVAVAAELHDVSSTVLLMQYRACMIRAIYPGCCLPCGFLCLLSFELIVLNLFLCCGNCELVWRDNELLQPGDCSQARDCP